MLIVLDNLRSEMTDNSKTEKRFKEEIKWHDRNVE